MEAWLGCELAVSSSGDRPCLIYYKVEGMYIMYYRGLDLETVVFSEPTPERRALTTHLSQSFNDFPDHDLSGLE